MGVKPLDLETLEKYFVERDRHSYGKITSREQRDPLLHMDKELAEALNTEECQEVQANEYVCSGRLNSKEVDHYLSDLDREDSPARYNDIRLLNLFILQSLELKVGAPLFTDSAKGLIQKHFAKRIEDIYGNSDLTGLRREVGVNPYDQQKTYQAKFSYQGQPMDLVNGGFQFDTQVWDPYKGESGDYENITVLFYHSDLFVMGDGSQLINEPTVLPRLIPALDLALLSAQAIEKLYEHPLGYQLETEGQSSNPDTPAKDLPVMVLYWDPKTVFINARRSTFEGDKMPVTDYNDGKPSSIRHVKLIVSLDKLGQDDFIVEEADLSRLPDRK